MAETTVTAEKVLTLALMLTPDQEIVPDHCYRCARFVEARPFAIQAPNGVVTMERGAILTPQGALYCRRCAPDVRTCSACGCTDEVGCEEGCWWVSEDQCSACAGEAEFRSEGEEAARG